MCKRHLNTVENIYKNIHPLMKVYTHIIAYVEEVQCIMKLKLVHLHYFQPKIHFGGRFTPLCVDSRRGR